jgi:hypothetical protein
LKASYVDNVLAACAQTLFALRTLQQYGLPTSVIQHDSRCHAGIRLPNLVGFSSAADKARYYYYYYLFRTSVQMISEKINTSEAVNNK